MAARVVTDEGPLDAKLVLVGEAPGREENRTGRPFMGASGAKLGYWWRERGLKRHDFYITNVLNQQPTSNDLSKVHPDDINAGIDRLHDTLAKLTSPWLIVPTGNVALQALTGLKGITKYRSSILRYQDRNGRIIKCIPTIHPAAVFHTAGGTGKNPGRVEKHCKLDWDRIAVEAASPDINLPERTHIIMPTPAQCDEFLRRVQAEAKVMSVDIETEPANGIITMVGFSYDPSWSFVIPCASGAPPSNLEAIKALCETECEKVLQNGLYDLYWLWMKHYIKVRNYTWDPLAMHHAFDPVDDHSLAYLQSVFTREPYHKDEAKNKTKLAKYPSRAAAEQTYCGLDNCVQRELYDTLRAELVKNGQLEFYLKHYPPLFEAIFHVMVGGIRTDKATRTHAYMKIRADLVEIQDKLTAVAGYKMHAKVGLSRTGLHKLCFDVLGMKPITDRKTKKVTLNEVALRKMQIRYTEHDEVFSLIMQHRRKAQLSQFFDEKINDDDGYLRCELSTNTEAGRLNSKKNPMGGGRNLQNIDREVRSTFLPDPGHIFLEVDLSQAEARVVYVLSGNEDLIKLAQTPSWKFDQHIYNASMIFGIKPENVSYDQRYFGKRTVHGAQRGLQGEKMSNELLKEGYVLTPEECQAMLDNYMAAFPGIKTYFDWVELQIMRYGELRNGWGRLWRVKHEKADSELYRRAYSFLPQSEVADLINQLGFIPMASVITSWEGARICAQVHDSLLVTCQPQHAWHIAKTMQYMLERERTYEGANGVVPLTIGCEFKIGRNWKGDHEWKLLPSEEEFNAKVKEITT